jgi:hypothetical protein
VDGLRSGRIIVGRRREMTVIKVETPIADSDVEKLPTTRPVWSGPDGVVTVP